MKPYDKNKKVKTCENCGQKQFSIVKQVYEYVLKYCPRNTANIVKKEYGKRSKYLHTGKYFSPNNYQGKYIPQLSINDPTGHILQRNSAVLLQSIKDILKELIMIELGKQMI